MVMKLSTRHLMTLVLVGCGTTRAHVPVEVVPVFSPPFEGTQPVAGWFDHSGGKRKGQQRRHDRTWVKGTEGHLGTDFPLPHGTPVLAAAPGRVVFAGVEKPFRCPLDGSWTTDQKVVKVVHDPVDGQVFVTAYAHLSGIEVTKGQRVQGGERLGAAGATGCARGSHLHFGVWHRAANGPAGPVPVDPFHAALSDGRTVRLWADLPHRSSDEAVATVHP